MMATLGAILGLACAVGEPPPDVGVRIREALSDLQEGGFSFDPDVAFRVDPYAVCEGVACADLVIMTGRRTILLAPEATRSPEALRATLLEIWERYREPRPGSVHDLARGALRVARDGPRVGATDPDLLRRARLRYRQLYESLPPEERDGLPDPDTAALP
jgi:hypothetical protein